jgi:hypothetical protein
MIWTAGLYGLNLSGIISGQLFHSRENNSRTQESLRPDAENRPVAVKIACQCAKPGDVAIHAMDKE